MKMNYGEMKEEEEGRIEEVVTDYAKFMKERETREFLENWKKKGYKKVGITELLFRMWLLSGSKKSSKFLLKDAAEILEKLKGEGGWFSFLSELKLTPEKLLGK